MDDPMELPLMGDGATINGGLMNGRIVQLNGLGGAAAEDDELETAEVGLSARSGAATATTTGGGGGSDGRHSQMSAATLATNATTSSSATTTTTVSTSKSWIKLNVGGKSFLTTRQTLCRESGSFLARLSQEDHSLPSEKDESGSFLIDRDSDYFSAVLNYLRHGKVVLDHGMSEEGLREEAEFYNLPRLIGLCNERISEREKQKKSGTKHVYRVLQCHEDELTNVISAMSDGWKFEQLVPIGHSLHASESGQPEYLCVVSREYPVAIGAAQLSELSSDRAQFLQKKAMNG